MTIWDLAIFGRTAWIRFHIRHRFSGRRPAMEFADTLLIGWWLLIAIVCFMAFSMARRPGEPRQETPDAKKVAASIFFSRQAAERYQDKREANKRYQFPPPTSSMPAAAIFALIIVGAALLIGLLGLLWMSNWTRLLCLHTQLFMVGFGVAGVWLGVRGHELFKPWSTDPWPNLLRIALRPAVLAIGTLGVCLGLYNAAGDLFLPRLVVEGRVASMEDYTRYRRNFGTTYYIVINENRYEATRAVYQRVYKGERIRAELGAASKMIFDASRI